MLALTVPLAAGAAVSLLAWVAYQLRLDRLAVTARHRPDLGPAAEAISEATANLPIGVIEPSIEDALDPRMPLDEVSEILAAMGVADWRAPLTEWERAAGVSDAVREGWARDTVAAAGKSWDTHLAKFSGAVLPREMEDAQ
jgi:hypothetical protein